MGSLHLRSPVGTKELGEAQEGGRVVAEVIGKLWLGLVTRWLLPSRLWTLRE